MRRIYVYLSKIEDFRKDAGGGSRRVLEGGFDNKAVKLASFDSFITFCFDFCSDLENVLNILLVFRGNKNSSSPGDKDKFSFYCR